MGRAPGGRDGSAKRLAPLLSGRPDQSRASRGMDGAVRGLVSRPDGGRTSELRKPNSPNPARGMNSIIKWFRPASPAPRRPAAEIGRLYAINRWRVFEAAFVAYAMFYIVRNNFAPVAKEIGAALHSD